MTYRITTHDGAVYRVEEVDLALISAYLALEGYPPVSVEPVGPDSFQVDGPMDQAKNRDHAFVVGDVGTGGERQTKSPS
jgi:hypothetical protein